MRFMIRLLAALGVVSTALLSASCGCCTSDQKPPPLRELPQFREVPPAQVEYAK